MNSQDDRSMQDSRQNERDAALMWEKVSEEHLVQDEWIDFRRTAYRLPDGTVFSPFYSYSRRDYVVIVASDTEGKYLCVRQFRMGVERVTCEFPAGGIERTDGREYGGKTSHTQSAEDALESAKRELLEETGYTSDEWTHLLSIPSNATIADNDAHLFMATNCRPVSAQHLDDVEFLSVEKHTAQEIEDMIRSGEFPQMAHVAAWLLSRRAG